MNSVVTSFKVRELFPLGKGGMGTTYLGCAKGAGGFERLIAIKRLHDHLQEDAEACSRLLSEAELAGCVHHANVVGVQHVDRDSRGAFLVLDYVEGGSLKELQRLAAPLGIPQPVTLRLILDCLAGLAAIHTATDHRGRPLQILHRDISPENILVGLDGMARLTDFGIARSRYRPSLTAPSQLVGKLGFMAPEYVDRSGIGPTLDIYSLGVTLWMLLTGKSPWQDLEEAQLLAVLLTQGVPEMPPDVSVSPALREIVKTACAMNPGDRYPTARDMAVAIEQSGARVSEHAEVATYVGKRFEYCTSERRLEAAQLLTIESRPPPSGEEEWEGESAFSRFFPALKGGETGPFLELLGEQGDSPLLNAAEGEEARQETEGDVTQVMPSSVRFQPAHPLRAPREDTVSTLRARLASGGVVRSSDPGNGDLLSHEIPPRRPGRSPGGVWFLGGIVAALLLSLGLFLSTRLLRVEARTSGAPPKAAFTVDVNGSIEPGAVSQGGPLAGPVSTHPALPTARAPQEQTGSPDRAIVPLSLEQDPPGPVRKAEENDAVRNGDGLEVQTRALEPEPPAEERAVSRPQPVDRRTAPGEIVSRNPYLK